MSKFIGAGLAIVVVGAVGLVGYKVYCANVEMENIMANINKASSIFPAEVAQTNTYSKGLFQTTGVYTLNETVSGQNLGIVVNYTIDHGIADLFKKNYPISATMNLKETVGISKMLGIKDNLTNVNGSYSKEKLVLAGEFSDIFVNQNGATIKVTPLTFNVLVNKKDDVIKVDGELKEVKSGMEQFSTFNVDVKDIVFSAESKLSNFLIGKSSLKISSIDSKLAKGEKFYMDTSTTATNNKYNTNFKFGGIVVDANNQKMVGSIDLNVDDLNKPIIDQMYEMYYSQEAKTDMASVVEKQKKMIAGLIKNGLKIKLNNLEYKDNLTKIKSNMLVEFEAQDLTQPFDLSKTLKSIVNIEGEGESVPMVKSMLDEEYFAGQDEKQAKATFVYNKGKVMLNEKQPTAEDLEKTVTMINDFSEALNDLEKTQE